MDTRHAPRARLLAYQWLSQADPALPERVLPKMLQDPSPELRYKAVSRLMDQAARAPEAQAVALYEQALRSARELAQLRTVAARLKKLGRKVDLARRLGCVRHWRVIGPWDNTDDKGFHTAYPPERAAALDYSKTYSGKPDKDGRARTLKWIAHHTTHPLGDVDLNKVVVEEKSVVAYAAAELESDQPRDVRLGLGSHNALKVWVNGRLVAEHEVYHAGGQFDQYTCRASLVQGRNTILVKICQNAQTQPWARTWNLTLRLCDATGGPVPGARVVPVPSEKSTTP